MAVAFVQGIKAAGSNVSTISTLGAATTGGNCVHADIMWYTPSGVTLSGFTDTAGNGFGNTAYSYSFSTLSQITAKGLYQPNATGNASNIYTVTLSGNSFPTLFVTEMSGVDLVAPLRLGEFLNPPPSTPTVTPNFTTTASALSGDFAIAGAVQDNAGYTVAVESVGWTSSLYNGTGTPANNAYKTASAGTLVYAPTLSAASQYSIWIVAYKPGSGGNIYNVTMAEAVTCADSPSSAATFPRTVAETAASADAPSSLGVLPSAIAETVSTADATSSVAVFPKAVAEAATATDAPAGGLLSLVSVTESASTADSPSSAAVLPSTVAEGGTASDSVASTATFGRGVAEVATATDAASGLAVLPSAVGESASATDTPSTGGQIYNVAVLEAATATDSPSAMASLAAAIAEAAGVTDHPSAQAQLAALVAEASAANDNVLAALVVHVAVLESATATDRASAGTGPQPVNPCNVLDGAPRRRVLGAGGPRMAVLDGRPRVRVLGAGGCC